MSEGLWAASADRERIAAAPAAVLMVGSYDGSGNYGDVLQFAAALDSVRRLPGAPLPVALVERSTLAHHRFLAERHPGLFRGAAFAHYCDPAQGLEDDLEPLPARIGPPRAAVYLYGGGYLNRWWGARKLDLVAAAQGLAGRDDLPLVASGLQIEAAALAPGEPVRALLERAELVVVRDAPSLAHLRDRLGPDAAAALGGDDAIPLLSTGPSGTDPAINLHLNQGDWVSDDPGATLSGVLALLRRLAEGAGEPLELRPALAYEDPRISEGKAMAAVLERHGAALERAGWHCLPPLDALADAVDAELRGLRSARLTISCSYHVALSSLLAGIPTVLVAENDYYEQKAAGLRDLFGLGRGMVGVRPAEADLAAAEEALRDGPARAVAVGHLRAAAGELVARHEASRAAVRESLERCLRGRVGIRPRIARARARRRAQ